MNLSRFKTPIILLSVVGLLSITSCSENGTDDPTPQQEVSSNPQIEVNFSEGDAPLTTLASLTEKDAVADATRNLANARVDYGTRKYSLTREIGKGHVHGFTIGQSLLHQKDVTIAITPLETDQDLYVYGKDGNTTRFIERSIRGARKQDVVTVTSGTLSNNENLYFQVVGWKSGEYRMDIYFKDSDVLDTPFPPAEVTSRFSTSPYATSMNAFYVMSNGQDLRGQCTHYSYSRACQLWDKGYLPKSIKDDFERAFWHLRGNRHAKNWVDLLGGVWHDTNRKVLPENLRKKGMIAVWQYGAWGHVGFVEEISADNKAYRLSDFNRHGNLEYKNKWYNFEGSDDRLGGVFPKFYVLD